MPLDILIAGGGLGGLALAQALQHRLAPLLAPAGGLRVRVYERDAAADAKGRQGYVVGLQPNGLAALAAIGVRPAVSAILEPGLQRLWVGTARGRPLMAMDWPQAQVAENGLASRRQLRNVLLQGVNVTWNARAARVEKLANGRVRLCMADGSTADGDVLVVADGAKSALRAQLLPQMQLQNTGVAGLPGAVQLDGMTEGQRSELRWLIEQSKHTLLRAMGPCGTSWLVLQCRPEGPGTPLMLVWVMNYAVNGGSEAVPLPSAAELVDQPRRVWRQQLERAARLPGVSPEFAALVAATPDENLGRPHDILTTDAVEVLSNPWGSALADVGCVSVIGDAAHAMTTHAGQGANTAFEDAEKLTEQLCQAVTAAAAGGGTLQTVIPNAEALAAALRAYETEMAVRASGRVQMSLRSTTMMHLSGPWQALLRNSFVWVLGWCLWAYTGVARWVARWRDEK